MSTVYAVGIGPGGREGMTGAALAAISRADVVCGYTVYTDLVKLSFPDKEYFTTPMRGEIERCRRALELADGEGKTVAVVCSGDAGVYGMAALIMALLPAYPGADVEVVPGVTAATAGAAVLGAPLGHDFCCVSLSDLLTPKEVIERRLRAAAEGDFVIALYNPRSRKRRDALRDACRILLESKPADTVCGWVRNIGRDCQESRITCLGDLAEDESVDMFTTVFIGSSQTREIGGRMVTPRGYGQKEEFWRS